MPDQPDTAAWTCPHTIYANGACVKCGAREPTTAAKRCGHKHRCACGLGLPMRQHTDPNNSRQGFCDRPCAYCDNLDAEEAERGY